MPDVKNNIAKTYYPGMDILRGIAILLVIFYHNFSFVPFSEFGFLGVDLFFVLSGFLITDILIRDKENNNFIRNFYIRRILRIFPIYYLTLLFLIFILPAISTVPYDVQYYRNNQYWFYTFLQNWLFTLKPLEPKFLLNHFWSLAIEEQFYLVWPLVIFFSSRLTRLLYILLGLFILVFFVRFMLLYSNVLNNHINAFVFLRFDGLLAGCAVAIFVKKGFLLTSKLLAITFIPAALLNAGFFLAFTIFKKHISYFPIIGYTSFSALFGLVVYYTVTKKNKLIKKVSFQGVLQFFGKISYGLYIFHWPVFILLFQPIQKVVDHHLKLSYLSSQLACATIVTISAILVSMFSYNYIEKKFSRLKNRFS